MILQEAALKRATVMVVGSRQSRPLLEALNKAGARPVLKQSMPKALTALRQDRIAAIVVDRARVGIDALEFVLNVRDVDPRLPVLIVGRSSDRKSDLTLAAQDATYLVDEPDSHESSVVAALTGVLAPPGADHR